MPPITARHDYEKEMLDESAVDPDPIVQFQRWFDAATTAGIAEPHAMTLATATSEGRPSARIVLMRGFDERGFMFFSNYESRKGAEIASNPLASLVFFWQPLERQVRVEGRVTLATAAESDEYFQGRPTGSKLGAWVSNQSRGGARPTGAGGHSRSRQNALSLRGDSATTSLGRLPSRSRDDRILAGPAESAP